MAVKIPAHDLSCPLTGRCVASGDGVELWIEAAGKIAAASECGSAFNA
jgi:hypothetical protein